MSKESAQGLFRDLLSYVYSCAYIFREIERSAKGGDLGSTDWVDHLSTLITHGECYKNQVDQASCSHVLDPNRVLLLSFGQLRTRVEEAAGDLRFWKQAVHENADFVDQYLICDIGIAIDFLAVLNEVFTVLEMLIIEHDLDVQSRQTTTPPAEAQALLRHLLSKRDGSRESQ
ncbi:hypothetical protein [Halorhodospira abdelmalekii]|uniref:hypothetical protein n=1 Tax=Halorhodospira abdelmalekii TaxID=421629 RepID=UPI0019088F21|nr:hypothetical protein [Halorhodospira abdelmalekii]